MDFLGGGLYSWFRNVKGMKSQFMTALSIAGVLGTATTAMAVNTDALSNLDPSNIGNATDTLLPDPMATTDPAQFTDQSTPTATPAPTDPSAAPVPVQTEQVRRVNAATPAEPGQAPAVPAAPSVQLAPVNGTTGGSGSRVESSHDDDDDHEEHDDDDDHEEEDDD